MLRRDKALPHVADDSDAHNLKCVTHCSNEICRDKDIPNLGLRQEICIGESFLESQTASTTEEALPACLKLLLMPAYSLTNASGMSHDTKRRAIELQMMRYSWIT